MEPVQMIIQQSKNVMESLKELKRVAHKKGKERYALIERFSANKHSFQVYTNMAPSIRDSQEVQNFLEKTQSFNDVFDTARYDLEGEVNVEQVEATYPEVLSAYEEMMESLEQNSSTTI